MTNCDGVSLEILVGNGDNGCQLDALTVQIKVDLGVAIVTLIFWTTSGDDDLVKRRGKRTVDCAIAYDRILE